MTRTLIKSRLHSNKYNPKIKQEINIPNQHYLLIFNHLSLNYYQETASLYINSFFTL